MLPVKPVVSLLALLPILSLAACNTANTRRDMYSPTPGRGYWTTRSEHGKAAADAELAMQKRQKPAANAATGTPAVAPAAPH